MVWCHLEMRMPKKEETRGGIVLYLTNATGGLKKSLIMALLKTKSDGSPEKNAYYYHEKMQSLKRD
jgi:hypothetical protein